jgi:hypothetical protein
MVSHGRLGQWSNYERRDGMCIPTEGEVAWLLPKGDEALLSWSSQASVKLAH